MRRVRALAVAGIIAVSFHAGAAGQAALVIDHRCTDLGTVPPEWLEQAKLLTFHYAHTSHGSQVCSGLEVWEQLDADYACAIRYGSSPGLPPVEDPPALRIYDGVIGTTYVGPGDYWSSEAGRTSTRTIAATGDYGYSMWSWCGELSWYAAADVTTYCETMSSYETEFPGMRFILMTGHTDGSGEAGTLNSNNNIIRQYARDHDMVLFDFADIEAHDPNGADYLGLGCNDNGDYSGGNWPSQWCAAHPGDPYCTSCSCAHSQPIICNLKGAAFWWMMARLAGWSGAVIGDLNCDGVLNFGDIDPFVMALTDPTGYAAAYSDCDISHADINGDGLVNNGDIDPFVGLLTGS